MKWLLGILLISLSLIPVSADEEITVEYINGWYGKGELVADNLSQEFVLHKNGNTIVSYATDARIINVSDGSIEFKSDGGSNELHALFLAPKSSGYGLRSIEFKPPNVAGEQDIRMEIEDAKRIVYLNGPVWLEGESIHQDGESKFINLYNDERIEIKYLTKKAAYVFYTISSTFIFTIFVLGLVFFKRETYKQKIRNNFKGLSLPFKAKKSSEDLEVKFNISNNISNYIGKKEGSYFLKIPKSLIALIFTVMLVYLAFKFFKAPVLGNISSFGIFIYPLLGLIGVLGLLILVMLLAINNDTDLIKTISILTGGLVLIVFSFAGLLAYPAAILAGLLIYGFSKIIYVDNFNDKEGGI